MAHSMLVVSENEGPVWGATWYDAAQALGTLLAVFVAVGVALVEIVRARRAERERDELAKEQDDERRRATAARVACWVERASEPSDDGTHYVDKVSLYLANEGDEPVFNLDVTVGIGDPPIQLGPLAVPVPLPVLPPRRERSWDISMGVLAFGRREDEQLSHPVARASFTDVRKARWLRDFDGSLNELDESSERALFKIGDEVEGMKQLGELDNPYNPHFVALAFLSLLHADDGSSTVDNVRLCLDDSPGWADFDEDALAGLRQQLENYGTAAHVWYPAPYVAYVRLIHDDDAAKRIDSPGYTTVRSNVLTMTYVTGRGWRIFQVGIASEANWIPFPPGALLEGPQPGPD